MSVVTEIQDIMKGDKEHQLEFILSNCQFKVYLIVDPLDEYDTSTIIPISYDFLDEFCYIEDKEYREKSNWPDYGIDNREIDYINEIMKCILSHKDEINHMIDMCGWKSRENYNNKIIK